MGFEKTAKSVIEFSREINSKIYNFDFFAVTDCNDKGEALQLSFRMIIWKNSSNNGKSLRKAKNGKIEISCKGHSIGMLHRRKKSCLRKCCGLGSPERVKLRYLETTGQMDFKKLSNTIFAIKAVGEPKPYPTINAEITFPCGSIYNLRISWGKDYEFTVDLDECTLKVE